jgi:hypothetical protein
MTRLVGLDRCKAWVNTGHDYDDAKLQFMIEAASHAVLQYLGITEDDLVLDSDGEQEFDSDGNPLDVHPIDQAATCLLVQHMYDGFQPGSYGRLPDDVTSMLYIRRREMGLA